MFINKNLVVAQAASKGRGVFAAKKIKAQTIIETSPVLVFSKAETEHIEKTLLYNYVFEWGSNLKKRALGLGYISMYNHSYNANCIYEMDFVDNTISIIAIKDIGAGEEVCINYNATPDDTKPVWFDKKYKKETVL